ncbi:hypothetical protein V1281_001587 [Nitrobacteraceae bacterium AZCC 2161]
MIPKEECRETQNSFGNERSMAAVLSQTELLR